LVNKLNVKSSSLEMSPLKMNGAASSAHNEM